MAGSVPPRSGPYRIVQRIGVGAMAEVFLAEGPAADAGSAFYALKRILPQLAEEKETVSMFLDEARLAALLVHPSICRVYGLEDDGESRFQVMEWIDGVSLRWMIDAARATGGLPVDVVARIGMDVAEALDYAHVARNSRGLPLGVVHRDVTPPNVMVGFDGKVKLLDFGLAKARTQLQRTRPGYVKGKFGYIAPEQLGGMFDPRTDVFQLGLCLHEALTGERVFPEDTAAAAVAAVGAYEGPPPIRTRRPDVPPELEVVVHKALARHPDERWWTAGALRTALHQAVRGDVADSPRMAMALDTLLPSDARPAPPRPSAPAPSAAQTAAAAVDAPVVRRSVAGWLWIVLVVMIGLVGFFATTLYLLAR